MHSQNVNHLEQNFAHTHCRKGLGHLAIWILQYLFEIVEIGQFAVD